MLVVPFRVFGLAALSWVSPPRIVLSGLAARSEFLTHRCIAPIWLGDPTLPLTVSSAVWFSKRRASLVTFQYPDRALSSSCASIKSITQPFLADQSRPISSSHGLLFPTAHTEPEVRFTRVCQPATFRLQGLATLLAAYTLWSLAGFISHRQHSWDSPFGAFPSRKVSGAFNTGWTRLSFYLSVLPPPERWAGPTGLDFRVSTLPRVPGDRQGFSSPIAGCSLGFSPFQGPHLTTLSRPSPGLLSRALHIHRLLGEHTGAPEYRLVANWLCPRGIPKYTRRTSNPLRVPAPARSRTCRLESSLAIDSPCAVPRITAG